MSEPTTSWSRYIESLENNTGRFGGDDTVCCQACGKRIETSTAQFSRYDGEPLCGRCADTEATED